jgi:group I intron endonuclease
MESKFNKVPGIYKITDMRGRSYIGSAVNLYGRYHRHKHDLIKNTHTNKRLQNYFNKYGVKAIHFEVIELCERGVLVEREQYWIDSTNPYFNICKNAGSTLGFKMSKKTTSHLSKIRKGVLPKHLIGTNHTPEARLKISKKAKERGIHPNCVAASKKANTGRKHSSELRDKISKKQRKITPKQAAEILYLRSVGVFQMDIAERYGISQRLVCRIEQKIGIYGHKDYYDAACKRFKEQTAQGSLFGGT